MKYLNTRAGVGTLRELGPGLGTVWGFYGQTTTARKLRSVPDQQKVQGPLEGQMNASSPYIGSNASFPQFLKSGMLLRVSKESPGERFERARNLHIIYDLMG